MKELNFTAESIISVAVAVASLVAVLVVGYKIFTDKPNSQEAMKAQVDNLTRAAVLTYANHPLIPDGDITSALVSAEMIGPINGDRAAMYRLKVDAETRTIKNEFGGEVRVLAKDNVVRVIYTKVPDGACASEAVCQ